MTKADTWAQVRAALDEVPRHSPLGVVVTQGPGGMKAIKNMRRGKIVLHGPDFAAPFLLSPGEIKAFVATGTNYWRLLTTSPLMPHSRPIEP